MAITVTMSMAAAESLQKALTRYRPSDGERVRHQKSMKWMRESLSGQKGEVTLTAQRGSLLWLAECVVQPGVIGGAAGAAIIGELSKAGKLPPQKPVDAAKLAAEVKRDIADGKYEWAMTGW